MPLRSWLVGVLALAANVHAVVALVLGLRSRDADVMARYARRCVSSIAGFALLGCGTSAASLVIRVSGGPVEPSRKATILASGISELMNCSALVVVVGALSFIAAYVLRLRARRAHGG
jgi:hypothetical protein